MLKAIRFKVILAAENVRDGSGYELAPLVARQSGNLFNLNCAFGNMSVAACDRTGVRSLGKRALNPWMLETELEFPPDISSCQSALRFTISLCNASASIAIGLHPQS